jgi:hypothetical protein
MRKLLLLTTAGILAAGSVQPGFAASRGYRADPPQATEQLDPVRREYYNFYGINPGFNANARGAGPTFQTAPVQAYPSHNLSYPDRPWGAPDRD